MDWSHMYATTRIQIMWHDMDTLTCQSGKECGHYLQVIWAKTRKVGCAIGKCRYAFYMDL